MHLKLRASKLARAMHNNLSPTGRNRPRLKPLRLYTMCANCGIIWWMRCSLLSVLAFNVCHYTIISIKNRGFEIEHYSNMIMILLDSVSKLHGGSDGRSSAIVFSGTQSASFRKCKNYMFRLDVYNDDTYKFCELSFEWNVDFLSENALYKDVQLEYISMWSWCDIC